MRKMLMALGAVALLGGVATAVEPEMAQSNPRTFRVNRYAFNAAGPTPAYVAADRCAGGQIGTMRVRRTAGDMAATVFSAFLYTPEHVTVQCSPSATPR